MPTDGETIQLVDRTIRTVTEIIDETSFTDNIDKGIQTKSRFTLRELEGLDESMQTISGSLRKALAEKRNIEIRLDIEYGDLKDLEKDFANKDKEIKIVNEKIEKLKDDLEVRNDQIKILKDRFSNQVTQIKETIKKLRNKTLGEKIRILFREQGITIATLLTAFGMTIGFIVELLIPKSVPSITPSPTPKPTPPKPSEPSVGLKIN